MPPMSPLPPSLIILNAAQDRYVLISLTTDDGYVEASVIENSKHLFSVAEWRSDGMEGRPHDYKFRRFSSRSPIPKIYPTSISKTNNYVIVPWHEPIHVYTMKYCGVILPSTYFRVYDDKDSAERWHFKKHLARDTPSPLTPSMPSAAPVKIPSHILRCFVESAIQKNEVCPITLDALVMGNVAMTSCGHLFEKEALSSSLSTSNVCPTCRADVKQGDIVIV